MQNEIDQKNKLFANFIWRFAERCGAQLVAFIVSIVLARILVPEAYGTVALITVFTSILQVFVDSGLGNALIQKKDADDLDFSTVFIANICFCTLLYILIYLFAPRIALFYNDMSMIPYIRVLSLTILISGVKNIQQAYVSRHMLFKKFFFSTLGGTITAGIVGVGMAISGFGVWALIAQQIINLAVDTVILWITVKWRPHLQFSFRRLKSLFSFGWKLLVASLLDTVYNDLRQLIIGKMYSSSDLAYYNQGKKFPNFIITNVNASIDSVLFPAMSNVQDNRDYIKNMTRKSIQTSVYIMAPLMMGLAFTADTVVCLVFTDKWLPCVTFLRIFCVVYMFRPIHTANLNAIKALGRSDLFLKMEIIKKVVGLVLTISTAWISVEAMAYSLLVSNVLSQIINAYPNKTLLGYSYINQLKDLLPSVGLAILMGLCVHPIGLLGWSDFITFTVQVIVGVMFYILGSFVLKLDSFSYLCGILKPLILKVFKKHV